MLDLVLIGPPGAGKGTQGEGLCARHHLLHLSMGDLLREAVNAGSELGQKVHSYVENGELVPDEVVAGVLSRRLMQDDARRGVLLDGYPRTVAQVYQLDRVLEEGKRALTAVLNIEVDDATAVRRLAQRRICQKCGAIYNLSSQPSHCGGRCDTCGAVLAQRDDDKEAVIRHRLQVYREKTVPLLEIYEKRGLLLHIDGNGDSEHTAHLIDKVLVEVQGG